MLDKNKTKKQLIAELTELRRQLTRLQETPLPLDQLPSSPGIVKQLEVQKITRTSKKIKHYNQIQAARTQRRLTTAIEQVAESVIVTTPDGTIIYVNPAFERITGYSRAEVIGQNPRLFQSGQQDEVFYRGLWQTISMGQVWRGCLVNKKKDGSLVIEEATISPVRDEHGTIVNYVAVQRDVTRELQLERQYHHVISSISDYIYVTEFTADGQHLNRYLSPLESLTGYPQQEFVDWHFWSSILIHPNDQKAAAAHATRLTQGQNGEIEYRMIRADGRVIWVRDSGRVETEGTSKIIYGIVSDISERKQAEEAVAQRAAQLALINDIGGRIVSVLELDNVLERTAYLVQSLFDYHHVALFLVNNGVLQLKALAGAYQEYFSAGHTQKLTEGINGWVATSGQKIVANDVSAEPRYVSLIAPHSVTGAELCLPIKIAEQVVGILDIQSPRRNTFTENDVIAMETLTNQLAVAIENAWLYEAARQELSERQRAEAALAIERTSLAKRVSERTAELSQANAELARAARLKDEFLANMSHELRTPLNTILGMAEVLSLGVYGALNPDQLNALGYIEEGGRHLLALINDILDLSKIEAGKIDLQITMVNLQEVCQASLLFIEQMAQEKQIKVQSTIDYAIDMAPADERRLKQILVNLLTNAVKFTPAGGQVGLEVQADLAEEIVRLTVWDTGIGIAEEDMPRLFKPFVQLDSSLSRQHEGSGLGLTLVYRLVEMHGGSISLESEGVPGKGSRFTVSLPWRRTIDRQPEPGVGETTFELANPADVNSRVEQAGSLTLAPVEPGHFPLILLAEDNETNGVLVCNFLQTRGYRVTIARNGLESVERAVEEQPDLILMDIQMPGLDGLQAIRRIRTHPQLVTIPIIALTALAMPGDRERCLLAGATAYLSKPFRLLGLMETIQNHLTQAGNGQQR